MRARARACDCLVGWDEFMNAITFSLDPLVVRTTRQKSEQRKWASHEFTELSQKLQCVPCVTSAQCIPPTFSFSLSGVIPSPTSREHPSVGKAHWTSRLSTIGMAQQQIHTATMECEELDQYTVGNPDVQKHTCARFCELLYAVAISNNPRLKTPTNTRPASILLGETGHIERLSFWTHFIGCFIFAIYALVRQSFVQTDSVVAEALTSVAAWTISAVFLTSSVYHATAPDLNFAMVTRVLDYAAIYVGIAVTTTADIAVATRGFQDVPYQTIVDLPISACLLILFFVWRRGMMSADSTWGSWIIESPDDASQGCLISMGLLSYGHKDLEHMQMRQATSLLLFANYFMVTPASFAVLGNGVTGVVLALQISGFVTVTFGMAIDRIFQWPDKRLVSGRTQCLACPSNGTPPCGAVLNSHALWHIVALLSAGLTCVSREYALSCG